MLERRRTTDFPPFFFRVKLQLLQLLRTAFRPNLSDGLGTMRRLWLVILTFSLGAMTTSQLSAQRSPTLSYELVGCDGIKSCHRMWFNYWDQWTVNSRGNPDAPKIWELTYAVQGTFNIPGAYNDPCFQGCAWDITPANDFRLAWFNEHVKHAYGNCSIVDLVNTESSLNRWCTGTPSWAPSFRFLYLTDLNWRPESAEVYVRYEEDGFLGPPSVVKLALVPEPATYATTALGLIAVAFAVRRRRGATL